MVFFNWATMQMAAKVVYYGPGLCGKTTNLSYIYAKTAPGSRGEMVSLETESDRTLFFDLLPIEVGTIGGFKTRLQLYTVPGQVFYNTTRKLVLKGVDGVVFVADSQRPMREANIESFENLRENLAELGLDLDEIPLVLQFNKRDLKNILTIEELNSDLNPSGNLPWFESSAINGEGVFETLKEITKVTLKKLRKKMASPRDAGPRLAAARPVAPRPATPRPAATISAAALARAAEEGVEEVQPQVAAEAAPSQETEALATPPLEVVPPAEATEAEPGAAAAEAEAEAPPETDPNEVTAVGFPPVDDEAEPFETGAGDEQPEAVEELPAEEETPAGEELPEEAEMEAAAEAAAEEPLPEAEEADEAEVEEFPAEVQEVEEADEEADVVVDFDQQEEEPDVATPPPVKRVHVSNQMDILAELDSLRERATMGTLRESATSEQPDIDIDSLLAGELTKTREVRRKVTHGVNSDIFKRTSSLQVAVRLVDSHGDTVHTLEPISLPVQDISGADVLSLLLTLDLENQK